MNKSDICGAMSENYRQLERQKAEEILRLYEQLDGKNQVERLIRLNNELEKSGK